MEVGGALASWSAGLAKVSVFQDRQSMGGAAAGQIARRIAEVARTKASVRMIFAAAPSQTEMISSLLAHTDLPWESITAFHMDDYLELSADAPQRFANWLDLHLFSKVAMGAVHRIPTEGAPEEICADYARLLSAAPIDIVCLGIGVNGHIAFNDPPVADFQDRELVKLVELDETCRQQQVDDKCFARLGDVPRQAITLTIPQLCDAAALFCVVPGQHKRHAVKAALEGPVSTACPASILRTHPNCQIFLDKEASPDG